MQLFHFTGAPSTPRIAARSDAQPAAMRDPVDALVTDLLEWIGSAPRPYAEVMDAWRTSCPRLPVWEEANLRGLVECTAGQRVQLTAKGRRALRAARLAV